MVYERIMTAATQSRHYGRSQWNCSDAYLLPFFFSLTITRNPHTNAAWRVWICSPACVNDGAVGVDLQGHVHRIVGIFKFSMKDEVRIRNPHRLSDWQCIQVRVAAFVVVLKSWICPYLIHQKLYFVLDAWLVRWKKCHEDYAYIDQTSSFCNNAKIRRVIGPKNVSRRSESMRS